MEHVSSIIDSKYRVSIGPLANMRIYGKYVKNSSKNSSKNYEKQKNETFYFENIDVSGVYLLSNEYGEFELPKSWKNVLSFGDLLWIDCIDDGSGINMSSLGEKYSAKPKYNMSCVGIYGKSKFNCNPLTTLLCFILLSLREKTENTNIFDIYDNSVKILLNSYPQLNTESINNNNNNIIEDPTGLLLDISIEINILHDCLKKSLFINKNREEYKINESIFYVLSELFINGEVDLYNLDIIKSVFGNYCLINGLNKLKMKVSENSRKVYSLIKRYRKSKNIHCSKIENIKEKYIIKKKIENLLHIYGMNFTIIDESYDISGNIIKICDASGVNLDDYENIRNKSEINFENIIRN